jgi:hypothetical protein
MSYASKKYTFGKSIPRSKESIDAECARVRAEWKRYEANRAFLDKVAEGERASHAARFKEAQAEEAAKKYPFQGSTFDSMSYTFQPQTAPRSWALEERERLKMQQEEKQ